MKLRSQRTSRQHDRSGALGKQGPSLGVRACKGLQTRINGPQSVIERCTHSGVGTRDLSSQCGYKASGGKYYIGSGNVAGMASIFGRIAGFEGPGAYVFFVADSQHPAYKLRGNVVANQMYVAAFDLEDYPVTLADILHSGQEAFDAGMNTVNVGKFNLGFGAEGLVEHCFYESITHAERRVLLNGKVTDFAHVQALFTDAYARLALSAHTPLFSFP